MNPSTHIPTIPCAPFRKLGRRGVCSLFAFMGSLPLWSVLMGSTPSLFARTGAATTAVAHDPLALAALSAMFVVLAMLFVCLLKKPYAEMPAGSVALGAIAYGLGYVLLACSARLPLWVSSLSGALIGLGSALLCLAWATKLAWTNVRTAFRGIAAFAATGCVVSACATLVGPTNHVIFLAVIACVGAAGSALSLLATSRIDACGPPASPQDSNAQDDPFNWWEIFGHIDTAQLSGGEEFETPVSRVLFFVVTPLCVLLVAVANITRLGASEVDFSLAMGCALTLALTLPLLTLRSDRALIAITSRTALPLTAFIVLVVATAAECFMEGEILIVGITAYYSLYALLMTSLLMSMVGRATDLALPYTSFVILVACLFTLLVHTPESMHNNPWHASIMLVLLTASVVLLTVMPGARGWFVLTDLVPTVPSVPAQPDVEEQCRMLANHNGLTERETQVALYLAHGHGANFIAGKLGVSESTVRTHRSNIYRKLGISSREELIALVNAPMEPSQA